MRDLRSILKDIITLIMSIAIDTNYLSVYAFNIMNEEDKISKKHCKECASTITETFLGRRTSFYQVYYPGEINHLDGNKSNRSDGNQAMICPHCGSHILLAAYNSEDIWLLKTKGLNYAEIGRILGMSRERVRQLFNRHQARIQDMKLSEAEISQLVDKIIRLESGLVYSRRIHKIMDKRTLKKRILAALGKITDQDLYKLKDDLEHKAPPNYQ